jgi:hypothetical protein
MNFNVDYLEKEVKRTLHTAMKLLLVLTLFLGLQGKVIVRYSEIFHKNPVSVMVHSDATRVKRTIIHCNLQCYTQHFKVLDIPPVTFFFSLIIELLIINLLYISFKEVFSIVGSVRLLFLRGPPVF